MRTLSHFLRIIDLQSLLVILLSVAGTYLCLEIGITADIPTSLVGIAIVFPIVFSIGAAYKRREQALGYLASLKAQLMNIYYTHRDYVPKEDTSEETSRARRLITGFLTDLHLYFRHGPHERDDELKGIYSRISAMSVSVEDLREKGTPDLSRTAQSIRSLVRDFERMRNILEYRTPSSLRSYSSVFLNSFPVFFAPWFAFLGQEYGPWLSYFVAVLYSLVLVSLDNIQDDLENPFDMVGTDDIDLEIAAEFEGTMIEL